MIKICEWQDNSALEFIKKNRTSLLSWRPSAVNDRENQSTTGGHQMGDVRRFIFRFYLLLTAIFGAYKFIHDRNISKLSGIDSKLQQI